QHLARDELLRVREALRRAEVVDLAARRPGAAQLYGDVPGGAVARREARPAAGPGQREPPPPPHRDAGVARDIGEVADPAEHVVAALELEALPVALDRARPGERQHDRLELAGGER